MRKARIHIASVFAVAALAATFLFISRTSAQRTQQAGAPASREDGYRANNLGVALMEQFKYKEAADAFRRALQIDPKLDLARINLSIALYNVPDLVGAQKEAQNAQAAAKDAPQPLYILGLIARNQNRPAEAIEYLQRVLKIDANDVGTNVNLGQIYVQQRKYPEA